MTIKCLYGGCPKTFTDEEIYEYVSKELFGKYKKFKIAQLRLSNQQANFIHCPYPDCEDMIEPPEDQRDTLVQCAFGHQFCTRCKTIGWHKLGKCKLVNFIFI